MENYLLEEGDIDPIEKLVLLDRMESEDKTNGDSIKYFPGKKKNLTSTPLKDQSDSGSTDEVPRTFSSVDLSDDEGTASNNVSGRSSPMVAGLPTISITEDADPLEPEDIRVPILGYEVMDARAKFTSHPKPTKILFRPPRLKGKTGMREGQGRTSILPNTVNAPIVGYEIMEKRERTIVYKIEVLRYGYDRWFVFRRYNDFYSLHEQLKKLFPNFRLALPPRRWFRSNYDKDFLEERTVGLQVFLNNITGHKDICNCKCVRDFFCFDDPPGPHDSLEESRALCENLEETIYILRKELSEKDEEMDILQEELSLFKNQVELLTRELKELKTNETKKTIATSPGSNQLSLAECDQEVGDSDQSANSDSNLTTDSDERRNNADKIPFKQTSSSPVVGPDVCTS